MEMEKEMIHANCLQLQGTTYDYTLKCEPARAEELREAYASIIPGYYMNKTHWNSIYMDAEDVPMDLVENLIKHSYELVFNKLTKKAQQEICC